MRGTAVASLREKSSISAEKGIKELLSVERGVVPVIVNVL